ncbi:AAA family ATPase [Candidatus Neptunochlamydia vexilliferae]|uniref:AAA-ATPase-like domain-containing protein n=1 Tax=Candidatus Neptunichlamydia vexilliferae TaxID=1651774 RepID=A0ABS0B179_9BACT|nr:ATP-binding protein [Candidatus Neptunochlamydia vexilliferae]MBF5060152.1 hypothetical protein [Candidatus Neptunochlamydia vexilliferae]
MKNLPIGIQSITDIIQENYVYVDKTSFAHKLVTTGKHYFISRPRRFGKSLFINTLKEILKGNKELFKDFNIYSIDYKWNNHPIIHFDFTQILTDNPTRLEESLQRTLQTIAEEHKVTIDIPSAKEGLSNLVKELYKKGKVVVLIDEYDKPIIDHLKSVEIAEGNRTLLGDFFGALKGLDDSLKLTFTTGISKFSQVSLFSGFNNLQDLTILPEYATLFGYTEEEILRCFPEHIKRIKNNQTEEKVLEEMKNWYNGYQFSQENFKVYNPFSTLNFLATGVPQSFWYNTGTPSFLIELIKNMPKPTFQLSGIKSRSSELLNISGLKQISLKALMWQTGYLSFKDYDFERELYTLDFPNREVRRAFFDSLIEMFAQISSSDVSLQALECREDLAECQLESFFKRINVYFARIPYHLFKHACEGFYHSIFLILLEGMGIKTRAEDPTNIGRIDLAFEIDHTIYIMEFKLDKDAESAFEQADLKGYKSKYSNQEKNIVVVGINFDSKSHNISEWKAEVFSPNGEFFKSL